MTRQYRHKWGTFGPSYFLNARWTILFIVYFETDIGRKHLRKVLKNCSRLFFCLRNHLYSLQKVWWQSYRLVNIWNICNWKRKVQKSLLWIIMHVITVPLPVGVEMNIDKLSGKNLTKRSQKPIVVKICIIASQWELKIETGRLHETRENVRDQITIG